MHQHQKDLIEFLVTSEALRFGEFTLKSGRKSPHFMNTGNFNDGAKIARLGEFYAAHLMQSDRKFNVIFGPAYKGIPLAVTTALTLSRLHNFNIGFSFNRKEAKDHGDGGTMVGTQLKAGDSVVIVEDVITAGTTLKEVVPLLRETYKVNIHSVVILLDRSEKGADNRSAVQEAKDLLDVTVSPIITIHDVVSHLFGEAKGKFGIDPAMKDKIDEYLKQYGA